MRDAVIFDMDGLLLDTERVAFRTFKETCAHFRLTFETELYYRCVGGNLQRTSEILEAGIKNFPKEEFMRIWNGAYVENAIEKPVPVKAGVLEFLKMLKSRGVPCALATSTPERNTVRKLSNAGLSDYFSALTFGDQVTFSKPHPEIYLKSALKLGIKPQNCLALEDSDTGVRAAHGAGMLVFQIPDMVPPSKEVLALGHDVLSSMIHVHDQFVSKSRM